MITAAAMSATGTAGWPASRAGIMKTPHHRTGEPPAPPEPSGRASLATARTTTANSPATSQSEVDRSISK